MWVFSHKSNWRFLHCLAYIRREFAFDLHCSEVYRDIVQNKSAANYWARRAAGSVINVHVCYELHCPAFHSSPISPSMSLSPLSAGRRGVTWCAEEDQWHAGGDSKEDGQPIQTRQHLHHWRKAPGWAQLCYQQVRWLYILMFDLVSIL